MRPHTHTHTHTHTHCKQSKRQRQCNYTTPHAKRQDSYTTPHAAPQSSRGSSLHRREQCAARSCLAAQFLKFRCAALSCLAPPVTLSRSGWAVMRRAMSSLAPPVTLSRSGWAVMRRAMSCLAPPFPLSRSGWAVMRRARSCLAQPFPLSRIGCAVMRRALSCPRRAPARCHAVCAEGPPYLRVPATRSRRASKKKHVATGVFMTPGLSVSPQNGREAACDDSCRGERAGGGSDRGGSVFNA